jgi:hypothetical protein
MNRLSLASFCGNELFQGRYEGFCKETCNRFDMYGFSNKANKNCNIALCNLLTAGGAQLLIWVLRNQPQWLRMVLLGALGVKVADSSAVVKFEPYGDGRSGNDA